MPLFILINNNNPRYKIAWNACWIRSSWPKSPWWRWRKEWEIFLIIQPVEFCVWPSLGSAQTNGDLTSSMRKMNRFLFLETWQPKITPPHCSVPTWLKIVQPWWRLGREIKVMDYRKLETETLKNNMEGRTFLLRFHVQSSLKMWPQQI